MAAVTLPANQQFWSLQIDKTVLGQVNCRTNEVTLLQWKIPGGGSGFDKSLRETLVKVARLDFQGQHLQSLIINYVAINEEMEKRLP